MKKVLPVLLAVVLMLSLSVSAFAASMTPRVDKNSIKAGEKVTVTVSLDEAVINVWTVSYRLYFNADLFEYGSEKSLCSNGVNISVSNPKTDSEGTYVNFSCMDVMSKGITLPKGNIVALTFAAKAEVNAEQAASFRAVYENGMASGGDPVSGLGAGPAATVTVTPTYTAAVSGGGKIMVNNDATVFITVANGAETSFNAYQFTLTYNPAVVTYKGVNDTKATVNDDNGTLTIAGYGADKTCGTPIAVTFTGKASGETAVTLNSAFADKRTNAVDQDTPAAAILNASATITVNGSYTVSLPDWFTGADTVNPGADYTFTAKDPHYDYTFTDSTMGGSAVTVVNNGDGTFKVTGVTGNLVIRSDRTPKTYTVTVTGTGAADATAAATAAYATDYTFTLNKDANYDYTVAVTVGGQSCTPALAADGKTYTIPGTSITGKIVIHVTKTQKAPTTTAITFTGSGSGDVDGGTSQTATNGQDFTFTIDEKAGYTYTVKLGNETLTKANGKYTIPGARLTGAALTVTVEKTANWTVNVAEYVKLNGKNVYLITVSGIAENGKAFAYDGNVMFTSTKYNAAAYLIISEKTLAEVKAEAQTKVSIVSAAAEAISYTGDVNGTGKVDVNDAQLVYDIYNAQHEGFATVSMLKFLRADVNGDKTVDVKDATAIISSVLK